MADTPSGQTQHTTPPAPASNIRKAHGSNTPPSKGDLRSRYKADFDLFELFEKKKKSLLSSSFQSTKDRYSAERQRAVEQHQADLQRIRELEIAEEEKNQRIQSAEKAHNDALSQLHAQYLRDKQAADEAAEIEARQFSLKTARDKLNQGSISARAALAEQIALQEEAHQFQLENIHEASLQRMQQEGAAAEQIQQKAEEYHAEELTQIAKVAEARSQYTELRNRAEEVQLRAASRVSAHAALDFQQDRIRDKTTEKNEELLRLSVAIEQAESALESTSDAEEQAELTEEIRSLRETYQDTERIYDEAISELESTLEGSDGYKAQAAKEDISKIKNTSAKDLASQRVLETLRKVAENDADRAARHEYARSEEGKAAEKERWKSEMKSAVDPDKLIADTVGKLASAFNAGLDKIDQNISSFYQYQSKVEARLQGSEESYTKSLKAITRNVGMSPVVAQKDVVNKLVEAVDLGIAYNVDLRAFLATVSEDIATTFNAFDANLLRLIRLQQADTTAARLGMEASLTKLFNNYFSDTSYLRDVADSVSGAILDANSQLSRDMSVEFEYMVQKWMGSLYSMGMDSNTINTIATGLNYLGTGNVEALNSNESLQSLLAMSASNAGLSYADILTGGLDADTTNKLMKSMVEYLQSIASNTENNQVTKSSFANIFGFNVSDLTALSSLSSVDIQNIYNESLNYESAMDELNNQMSMLSTRIHMSQQVDTLIDNAMMNASTAIGNNAGVYATWKILNIVEDLTGGIAIPAISVMGNMVDLNTTVTALAKGGIAGVGFMGSLLGSVLSGGGMFGTTDVNKWGYEQFTSRGTAVSALKKGSKSGFSESAELSMVGSGSADDMKQSSLSDAADQAEEDSKVTNANVEKEADIYEKILAAVADEETSVLAEAITTNELLREHTFKVAMNGMDDISALLGPERVFLTAMVSGLALSAKNLTMNDQNQLSITEGSMETIATMISSNEFLSEISHAMSQSGSDVDIWSILTPITDAYVELKSTSGEMWQTIAENEAQFSTSIAALTSNVSTDLTKNIESEEQQVTTATAVTSIAQLADTVSKWEALVAVSDAHALMKEQSIMFPDAVQASITDFSPAARSYIAQVIEEKLIAAFGGDAEEPVSLGDVMKEIAADLRVTVANSYFDEFLLKSTLTS